MSTEPTETSHSMVFVKVRTSIPIEFIKNEDKKTATEKPTTAKIVSRLLENMYT